MAALANIVVKKNDNTTDITYTGVNPSSGDGTPAIWKSASVGSALAHQPELRLSAKPAAKGANRALRATYSYPQIAMNSTTGVTSIVNRAFASADFNFPTEMTQADVNEFAAQFVNLLASSLVKSCVQSGTSAT